jgi:hypothetical protein
MTKRTTRHAPVFALLLSLAIPATGVMVSAADPGHVQQALETGSCDGCDLADAPLAGLVAELGSFENADLTRASLYKASLRGANLTGAFLSGANLLGADLFGAVGADLTGAVTDDATVCPDGASGPC